MNNDTYYDTEVTTLQANENIDITKIHLSEKKRKLLRYAGDFSEEDVETPRKRKMFWRTYQQMIKTKNDKIKLLQQKNRSLKLQINNLYSLIDDLQSQSKLNANGSYMLKNITSDEEKHLLMRQLKLGSGKNITPELRKFAIILHYYSPSAYLYIRKLFSKALPDISTIRKWYTTINGLPGLTRESFQAISIKVN
ncbi:uncharacterized protein LOC132939331 [Metopolophium dirhodum]|uniref:uncharacterized protein LOC132939331 n=1 Tax=Metopolophium dirhodum TaxID=44670 RepID=UPI0029900B1E|nr:uncharacterized protein LOC132939331 [Metopolophium dirhodum]